MTPQQLAQALGGAKYIGGGEWQALCPCHDDHDPSLAITTAENGKLLFTCCGGNGCSQDAVLAELRRRGLWSNRDRSDDGSYIVYDYVDEYGALLFQVCKAPATPTKPKRFWQRQPDGQGGWKRKLDPKTGKMKLTMEGARLVPYHLDRLVAARKNANGHPPRVYICEGEKDADNLAKATTPSGAL